MKKMTMPTGNIRLRGQAEKDGIAFQAAKFNGPFRVSIPGTFAIVRDGNVSCSTWDQNQLKSPTYLKISKLAKPLSFALGISAITILLTYLVFMFALNKIYSILGSISCAMLCLMNLSNVVSIFISRISGNKEIQNFAKFEAAKNAVQNAYYDLRRVPNIDEVKKYSTFSYYNKYLSRGKAFISTFWLGLVPTLYFSPQLRLLGMLFILLFVLVLWINNALFFWQFLMLSKPKDIHFQVAIAALESCISGMDSIRIHVASTHCFPEKSEFDHNECNGCPWYNQCKELSQSLKQFGY